ncbi:MAG: FimV/HubP family polar landmark protein [Mariprofundus sp.]|nr:FimV/HubP family polar landmark protein [Mariprofundus sp.]
MRRRCWHKAVIALFAPALFLFGGNVSAASLTKIEVASHLGEPFYAEVPVRLESGEQISKVLVEIASSADYKIFEVYRDPVLKNIRADIASDERGVRVELSSSSRIKAPFFNLILKIHSGRVSRFKKIPVFLDVETSVLQAAKQHPQPSVQAVQADDADASPRMALTESAGQIISSGAISSGTAKLSPGTTKVGDSHDKGWARTGRYGPIVRGDSLSIVAKRLMIDDRYSLSQISLALFEKNRSSFARDNMNLLKKNSFLDVPTADEVEQHSLAEASLVFLEHENKWHKLIQQPRYAAEAEAQRTRYTRHISVGEHADGVAAAPVVVSETVAADRSKSSVQQAAVSTHSDSASKAVDPVVAEQQTKIPQSQNESSQVVEQLQGENRLLRQQLVANQENIELLTNKIDDIAVATTNARIDKLEVLITRLQAELGKAHAQRPVSLLVGMDWVIWVLVGLLVILLGTVAVLLRREPVHPAASSARESSETTPVVDDGESKEVTKAVAGSERVEKAAVTDPLSASGGEFGNAEVTESVSVEENSGNLPMQDFDEPDMEDIDFGDANLDVSNVRAGQENNDQSPFDIQGFNEPEATDSRHNALFDDEGIDSSAVEPDGGAAASAENESNKMAGFATGAAQESDHLVTEFMGQGDEKTAIADDEEPIRHLDSLLSKFEDDSDLVILDDEGGELEKSFFEPSDVGDVTKHRSELVIDDDLEQVETRESSHQPDELNDDEDNEKG